jgi:hypothetical protein
MSGGEQRPSSDAVLQERITELEAELAAVKADRERLDRCERRLDGYDDAWSAMGARHVTPPAAPVLYLVRSRDRRSHAG